jgi:hypothetical protein
VSYGAVALQIVFLLFFLVGGVVCIYVAVCL